MNPEQFGQYLDELGQRVGPYGDAAWNIAVGYHRTNAIAGLIFGAMVLIIMSIWVLKFAPRIAPWRETRHYLSGEQEEVTEWFVGNVIVLSLIAVAAVILMFGNITGAVIPEYHALQDLLSALP